MKLMSLLSRQRWLTGLLGLAVLARLAPIWVSHFPFMYDHAKDSLVIMEMVVGLRPVLLGAATSIDGVFNGPAFYYLFLPLNLLTGFHPIGSVLTVLALSLICIYLIYRFVGWFEALLYATSIGVVGTQQSAWSPYLTTLIMVPILIVLWQYRSWKKIPLKPMMILFFFLGLLFHAQTAFGVVMVLLILVILFAGAFRISWRAWGIAVLVFASTFLPFLVFELRHDFHQTKQVMGFISDYRAQAVKVEGGGHELEKPLLIGQVVVSSATQSLVPIDLGPALNLLVGLWLITFAFKQYLFSFWQQLGEGSTFARLRRWLTLPWWLTRTGSALDRQRYREFLYLIVLIAGTALAYLFLPFKPYYLVALYPVWIILLGNFLAVKLDVKHLGLFSSAIIIFALGQVMIARQDYQAHAQLSALTLNPKLAAVERIYQLSEDEPFVVYSFVPEIYDYTYQHLFLRERFFGRQLPVKFGYGAGDTGYMAHINKPLPDSERTQRTFLIVESADPESEVFKRWWDRVVGGRGVIATYEINQAVVVYELGEWID